MTGLRWLVGLAGFALLSSGCLAFHRGAMPGEPTDATYLELNGVRVRYLDVGTGPAVVMIHGFASSLETWAAVIPELKKNHRVVALDLKGFGWSDRPDGDYSPEAQARLVEIVMGQLGIEHASLVAHSWGASVALSFATQFPQKVNRIVLYDAWVYEEQLPAFFHLARTPVIGEILFGLFYNERSDERMAHAFFDNRYESEALVEAVEKALARPGTRAAALAAVRGQLYSRVQGGYVKISAPTLLLWGREDHVTTLPNGEALVRQLPNARLEVYPRCGHFPMIEAAAESTRATADFLQPERLEATR